MARRLHVDRLSAGRHTLDETQSKHAITVLRLEKGYAIELFDDFGQIADAVIVEADPHGIVLHASTPTPAPKNVNLIPLTVASAVPKGDRADWMIEKLSEVGVDRFIPLKTERSVVHPEGKGKLDRWRRIAIESAKQCWRGSVMQIDPLTTLGQLGTGPLTMVCSTVGGMDVRETMLETLHLREVTLIIGPEGDFSEKELFRLLEAHAQPVELTKTILRTETAAVVAAGVVATLLNTADFRSKLQ